MIRNQTTHEILRSSQDHPCSSYFNISKYLSMDMTCYSVRSRDPNQSILRRHITQASLSRGTIYSLRLPANVTSAHFDFVLLEKGLPHASREYASRSDDIWFPSNDPGKADATAAASNNSGRLYFFVTSVKRRTLSLPAPYDTRCFHIHNYSKFLCLSACLKQWYAPIGRVSCTEIVDQPIDAPCLDPADMSNESMRLLSDRGHDVCSSQCDWPPCRSTVWVTKHSSYRATGATANGISVTTPNDADMVITVVADMTFVEYFSFVTGCIGCWFGVSFLSLQPFVRRRCCAARISVGVR